MPFAIFERSNSTQQPQTDLAAAVDGQLQRLARPVAAKSDYRRILRVDSCSKYVLGSGCNMLQEGIGAEIVNTVFPGLKAVFCCFFYGMCLPVVHG